MRLKELRLENNLTQVEVAKAIYADNRSIGRWENDDVQPTAEFIIRLADFFEVSTDYLLGRSDDLGNVVVQSSASGRTVMPQLAADERELLDCYHSLSKKYRGVALDTLRGLSGRTESGTTKKVN